MKISTLLLIVVLVATAVSFLTDGVFSWMPNDRLLTILIAIAGGLIAALLVAMAKTLINTKGVHVILSAAIGTLVVFFILFLAANKKCDSIAPAQITCGNGALTYSPEHIEVCQNGKIIWTLGGTATANVKIDKFKKRYFFGLFYKKAQPLNAPDFSQIVPAPIVAMAIGKKGHFKYTITCTGPGGGVPIVEDPMIDVPKK